MQEVMNAEGVEGKLEGWDWRHYTEKVRKARFDLDQEEIAPYFARARAFVLPSIEEPWGLVVNEAMACGLPVVATTAGALPEVVEDGRNGILVPPRDAYALAGAIERLPVDAVLIDVTAEGGKLTVSHLMCCQWLTDLTHKPLLVAIGEELADSELQALWETGATGVIAEIGVEQPREKLLKLRQAIKALPANMRGRWEGRTPILPHPEPGAILMPPEEI